LEHNPFSILDIGAGTGLIALMLAQRSGAEQIDALEIDDDAYEQAVENFEESPWSDRLFCYHAGLDEFMEEPEDEYDLIVSNPPFYTDAYPSGDEQRAKARFADALPFEDLLEAATLLLSGEGVLAVIIPYKEEEKFLALAKAEELYPFKITRVKGTPESETKRTLLAFSRMEKEVKEDELVIETARHIYTKEYIALTQDFYLKM
jgi:tRNA1Val (adenine37-N6)-methyltransferase